MMSIRYPLLILAVALLSACATKDGPPKDFPLGVHEIKDAVPRHEPLSRYGNPPSYKINGKTYRVMKSSKGYDATGTASWYGTKFHGKRTSSGEPYSLYSMTAAHTSLPLPTYVEVTNLENNRKVIVKVNDRGPFADNRLIDLSYAAAKKLGFAEKGTARVRVRSIDTTATTVASGSAPAPAPTVVVQASGGGGQAYVQLGVFSVKNNAERLAARLRGSGLGTIRIEPIASGGNPSHRVLIGPLTEIDEAYRTLGRLIGMGMSDGRIVVD